MASAYSLCGLVLLALAFISCAVSFVAPYWYMETKTSHIGLWARCESHQKCTWFYENDFTYEKSLQDWVKACQGLFAFGIVTLLIAFLVACINLCCGCCREAHAIIHSIGGLLLFAFLLIVLSLGVFGYKGNSTLEIELTDKGFRYFYWGYWLGVGGCGLVLVSLIFYACDCFRNRGHEGYTRGECP